ncbi:MAG: sulfite exporter TauE/SafE family protein [Candidatus Lustribacter sp.]
MTEAIVALGGFGIGILGTLIGAGGGFLIVPLLVLLEPSWTTEQITAFSLAVVTANATTGALSYWWQGRVDPFTFPLYTLAAVPGSIAGAYASAYIPRHVFDPVFGVVLMLIGGWLFLKPGSSEEGGRTGYFERILVDRGGRRYEWSFDPRIGFAGSLLVGFASSVLGIGGGIIHVPLLATVLGFPTHVATATSHAVLAVTAGIATVVHVARGDFRTTWPLVLAAAGGAVVGAPVGARVSTLVRGAIILRILATALAFVGLRLLFAR